MQTWKVTYAVNDGSGMFGLEPPRTETCELELETDGLEEQAIIEMIWAAVHERIGEHAVPTDAELLKS
ncbi:hypothetical protein [Actinomadura keratinilytica]|uniref:DUF1902 domain-containing protein n=1 Tax=Actinomadura keratinilytica TaxID=547461 RepID=A0ABP7Y534_9ACTN